MKKIILTAIAAMSLSSCYTSQETSEITYTPYDCVDKSIVGNEPRFMVVVKDSEGNLHKKFVGMKDYYRIKKGKQVGIK